MLTAMFAKYETYLVVDNVDDYPQNSSMSAEFQNRIFSQKPIREWCVCVCVFVLYYCTHHTDPKFSLTELHLGKITKKKKKENTYTSNLKHPVCQASYSVSKETITINFCILLFFILLFLGKDPKDV